MATKRLLVINPNTNGEVTASARHAALACAQAGTTITAVNPDSGPFAIEGPEDRLFAIPQVAAIIGASRPAPYDGYVLACFDDIGVEEGRGLVSRPVISIAEAGIRAATAAYRRFAIVTTVAEAVPTIEQLAEKYGVAGRCTVRATGIGVAEAARQSSAAEARLLRTILDLRREGAEAVILGSGAYVGRAAELTARCGVPIIDGLEAAIRYCETASHRLPAG